MQETTTTPRFVNIMATEKAVLANQFGAAGKATERLYIPARQVEQHYKECGIFYFDNL